MSLHVCLLQKLAIQKLTLKTVNFHCIYSVVMIPPGRRVEDCRALSTLFYFFVVWHTKFANYDLTRLCTLAVHDSGKKCAIYQRSHLLRTSFLFGLIDIDHQYCASTFIVLWQTLIVTSLPWHQVHIRTITTTSFCSFCRCMAIQCVLSRTLVCRTILLLAFDWDFIRHFPLSSTALTFVKRVTVLDEIFASSSECASKLKCYQHEGAIDWLYLILCDCNCCAPNSITAFITFTRLWTVVSQSV